MVLRLFRGILACAVLTASVTPAFPQAAPARPPAPQAPAATTTTRQLSVDDAVQMALENNLGLQVTRMNPQIEDWNIAVARAAWAPAFTTTFQQNSTATPNTSFLSGAAQGPSTTDKRFQSNVGVQQLMRWGGTYSVGWDGSRATTTNIFSNFSPQLRSSLSLDVSQPLLRNFMIDSTREQIDISKKNRDIADVQVRQSVVLLSRTVRNAYWNLAYDIAALQVQQQSLDLANESLRNTQARVDIGTTPPIDIVEAQAEVAQREEGVIVGQAQIEQDEDTLRTLIFNPSAPDFWTVRIEPRDLPPFQPTTVDVNAAVAAALEQRTDLQHTKMQLEANDISLRFLHNQTLPDVTASVNYGLTGLGGTQFIRGSGTGFIGPIIGTTNRGFGSVLNDLFNNEFPNWTAAVNIRYPIGASQEEASLARLRLEYTQSQTQLRNQQLQVATEVRQVARQVTTNQQRVQTTRASRELAERRLEAEQRKLAAGTSTNFLVFQAQRDLAQARDTELRAILDYQQSVVDFETVQQVPITGTAALTASTATAGGGTTGVATSTAAGATTLAVGRAVSQTGP